MSFFKKLTRSRTNSGNYQPEESDESYERVNHHDSQAPPSAYRHRDDAQSPDNISQQDSKMYSNRTSQDGFSNNNNNMRTVGAPTRDSGFVDTQSQHQSLPPQSQVQPALSAPDLLTQAFHAAVKPYSDRIAELEQQLRAMELEMSSLSADRHAKEQEVLALSGERHEMIAWIDKRGLRADVPPAIAHIIDAHPDAASLLSSQLDRKITIVNFDLHRLQDDLNDNISSSHFAAAMSKFIPDVRRMQSLPGGPRYAYEIVIKIVGNLTAHGGHESTDNMTNEEVSQNRREREKFFVTMDDELVNCIEGRHDEREQWDMEREIKRMEKNEGYIKAMGIGPYFPKSLGLMRQLVSGGGGHHEQSREQIGGQRGMDQGQMMQGQHQQEYGRGQASPPGTY